MNKKERVLAVMKGEKVDCVPAGFWFHYNSSYTVQDMIDAHIKLYMETGMDIIKIMQDYPYPVCGKINTANDWYRITIKDLLSEEFGKMSDIIRGVRKEAGNDVLVFQTMFGPFKAACMAFGDDVVMKYAKEAPEALYAGIKIIADGLESWAEGFLDAGADGIYYSAQFGEVGRFSQDEWEKLVKPSDLQILNVAECIKDKYNILHICGEPEYNFKTHLDWFTDYPADLINWSVKDNNCSLIDGKKMFKSGILGGMNNKGNIVTGTTASIQAEVEGILDEFGTKGIMVGADCTIQGKNISISNIKTACDAAHNYVK